MTTYAALDDPDFHDWFRNSKAADETGHPLLVFRGEHGRRDRRRFQTRHAAISLGDLETAILYATDPNDHQDVVEEPRIVAAYLDIQNPIMNDASDPFIGLDVIESALGRAEALRIALKFSSYIVETGHWIDDIEPETAMLGVEEFLARFPERLGELYFQAFVYLNDADEVAALKRANFDGAIHCGFGDNGTEVEYKVFNEGQIAPAAPWMSPDKAREFAAEWEARRVPASAMCAS